MDSKDHGAKPAPKPAAQQKPGMGQKPDDKSGKKPMGGPGKKK